MCTEEFSFSQRIFKWGISLVLGVSIAFRLFSPHEFLEPSFFLFTYDVPNIREWKQVFLTLYLLLVLIYALFPLRIITSVLLYLFFTADFLLRMPLVDWGDWILIIQLLLFIPLSLKGNLGTQSIVWRLLRCHIVFVMGVNGIRKLLQADWWNGVSLLYFTQSFKDSDLLGLDILLSEFPSLASPFSLMVIGVQFSFLFILFVKKSAIRWVYVFIATVLHLAMGLVMGMWDFQFTVILSLAFLLSNQDWEWLQRKSVSLHIKIN